MTDREFDEIVARCVSTAVFYQAGDWTGLATDLMTSEVRAMALALGEAGVSTREARARVVEPVWAELLTRYGPGDGPRLGRHFAEAFAGDDPGEIPLAVARPGRLRADVAASSGDGG